MRDGWCGKSGGFWEGRPRSESVSGSSSRNPPTSQHCIPGAQGSDFCRVSVYIKFQAGDVADGIPNTDRQASLIVSRVRCVAERIGLRRQLVTFVVARPCDFSVLIRGRELIAVDIESRYFSATDPKIISPTTPEPCVESLRPPTP